MLIIAAILAFAIGLAHSYLGERYLLIPLLRRENLPRLFGSDFFTKRTLRFAWHLTSIAWWGLAAAIGVLAAPGNDLRRRLLFVIALVFLLNGCIALVFSKGRHLSWIVFWAIATLCLIAAF